MPNIIATTVELQVIEALNRIAIAQEKLLSIAEEARKERMGLSEQMKKAFQRPLEEPKE
jgi:hypothetical protein